MKNTKLIILIIVTFSVACNNFNLKREAIPNLNGELKEDMKIILFSNLDYRQQLNLLEGYLLKGYEDSIAYCLGRTLIESNYSTLSKGTSRLLLNERLLLKAKEDSLDFYNFNFIGFSNELIHLSANIPSASYIILSHPEFFGERVSTTREETEIILR
ncbi:MAG: hypothetical protein R2809_10240 [Flavobacteriales bacterium]